jgi:hypothetical protein
MNKHKPKPSLPFVESRTILVLRADGSMEVVKMKERREYLNQIRELIKADTLDFVCIGRVYKSDLVMAVDDFGWVTEIVEHGSDTFELKPISPRKPINAEATRLYLQICRPGTTHQIAGDVAIMHDSDA